MRTIWRTYALGAGIAWAIVANGCGGSNPGDGTSGPNSNEGTDAGASDPHDGSSPSSPPPPDGVFVSPTGADMAAGTSTAPLKTIAAGIAKAAPKNKTVILCSTRYAEAVVVHAGVTIRGGYDCQRGWAPTSDRATIAPAQGIPLTVSGASTAVRLSYLALTAPDGVNASDSSVALFAANSADVAIDHVELQAGNGANGETPTSPPAVLEQAPNGDNGYSYPSGPG
ncbi:MAG TPA: hypothetical protein VNO21_27335, partial [Polyangiaceae bacterium]|nr:hypothetical protein [Polyangiaceae bacterium]